MLFRPPDSRLPWFGRGGLLGLTISLAGALLFASHLGTDLEEQFGLSWLFRIRGPIDPPAEMVVVTLDRDTATALGLSQRSGDWPRTLHADVVDTLTAKGASAIVFDMMFDTVRSPEADAAFAAAMERSGRVVLFQSLETRKSRIPGDSGSTWLWRETLISPVPTLADAARAMAPFPLPKVPARVSRFWAFKPSVGDAPTLPVVALQIYAWQWHRQWLGALRAAGAGAIGPQGGDAGPVTDAGAVRDFMTAMRAAFMADATLVGRMAANLPAGNGSLAALARAYAGGDSHVLNLYGPAGHIRTLPYHKLLGGRGPEEGRARQVPAEDGRNLYDLDGKCVFVGVSELYTPEQQDAFNTVYSSPEGIDISGVEIAATAFGNLLTDRTIQPRNGLHGLAIVFGFGFVTGVLAYLLPALVALPAVGFVGIAYGAAAQLAFNRTDQWLPLATPVLVQIPLALLIGVLGQYLLARRQRARAGRAVRYFVPDTVAATLTEQDVEPSALNRVVYAACLASDAEGYTSFSEPLAPNDLGAFMKDYFDTLASAMQQHDVDVWAFVADSLMCAWTSPKPDREARRKACLAALDARDAIDRFDRERTGHRLPTRIGLHVGWVQVGPAGGGGRFVYNVTGDPANTAARIQSLNKHLRAGLLASAAVVDGIDDVVVRPLGDFHIAGKSEPIAICEIIDRRGAVSDERLASCSEFAEALDCFRRRRWTEAGELFEILLHIDPHDVPAALYVQACRRNELLPPNQASTILHSG